MLKNDEILKKYSYLNGIERNKITTNCNISLTGQLIVIFSCLIPLFFGFSFKHISILFFTIIYILLMLIGNICLITGAYINNKYKFISLSKIIFGDIISDFYSLIVLLVSYFLVTQINIYSDEIIFITYSNLWSLIILVLISISLIVFNYIFIFSDLYIYCQIRDIKNLNEKSQNYFIQIKRYNSINEWIYSVPMGISIIPIFIGISFDANKFTLPFVFVIIYIFIFFTNLIIFILHFKKGISYNFSKKNLIIPFLISNLYSLILFCISFLISPVSELVENGNVINGAYTVNYINLPIMLVLFIIFFICISILIHFFGLKYDDMIMIAKNYKG